MIIDVQRRCADFTGYRAARVKSLFNVESGADFALRAELPLEGRDWKLGVIVGPSGSGKSSLGAELFGADAVCDLHAGWAAGEPIIDGIAPGGSFDAATAALTAVGLGSVPSWREPSHLLASACADSQLIDYAAASPSRKTFFYEVANALPSQFRRAAGRIPARCRNREACGPFFSIDCHSGFFGVWLLVWFPVAVLSAFKGISGRFA